MRLHLWVYQASGRATCSICGKPIHHGTKQLQFYNRVYRLQCNYHPECVTREILWWYAHPGEDPRTREDPHGLSPVERGGESRVDRSEAPGGGRQKPGAIGRVPSREGKRLARPGITKAWKHQRDKASARDRALALKSMA